MALPFKTLQVFPSMLTNMFPVANDTNGGQLVSEWNLKQTDSVLVDPRIQWASYPSYAQTASDFAIQAVGGTEPASLFIGKTGGLSNRAIIDGHFLEVLGRQRVNLLSSSGIGGTTDPDAVMDSGTYEIGLVAVYSGDSTLSSQPPGRDTQIAGSIDGTTKMFGQGAMFGGVAIVIDRIGELKTPADCPRTTDRDMVNCHLKLGSFMWQREIFNGVVGGGIVDGSVINYTTTKLQFLGAERILERQDGSSHTPLVSKNEIDPSKLYVYSTRPPEDNEDDGEYNHDMWTDVTFDTLNLLQARIEYDENADRVVFTAPYKRNPYQQDNHPIDREFRFTFPNANPAFKNNAGMMGRYYKSKVDELIRLNDVLGLGTHAHGRLKRVMDSLISYNSLPTLSNEFNSSDIVYILQDFLANDRTQGRPATPIEATSIESVPSTMRVVTTTPTEVGDISLRSVGDTFAAHNPMIADFTIYVDSMPSTTNTEGFLEQERENQSRFTFRPDRFTWNVWSGTTGQPESTDYPTGLNTAGWNAIRQRLFDGRALDGVAASSIQNAPTGYVRITISHPNIPNNPPTISNPIRILQGTTVLNTTKSWSNAIWLTPALPLATESMRGAVYSIPLEGDNAANFRDKGYCYVDEFGYIRLMDYEDLWAGGAWKFLQSDYETMAGQDLNSLRTELEFKVNKRASIGDYVVKIHLPDRDNSVARIDEVVDIIMGSVYQGSTTFIFEGSTQAIPVQFSNCDRIRIVDNTEGELEVTLRNTELWYDASIIQKALTVGTRSGIFGIRFWYKEFFANSARVREYPEVFRQEERDPTGRLIVNGSEFTTSDATTIHFHGNSNWFSLATFSPGEAGVSIQARICDVQFSPSGIITAIGLQMRNATTQFNRNVLEPTEGMTFMLPMAVSAGSIGQIPEASLKDSLHLQGRITTMYEQGSNGWLYMDIDVNIATESQTQDNDIGVRGGTVLIRFPVVKNISNVVDRTDAARQQIVLNNAWAANSPVYIKGKL
jgi:hypothetical protein